MSMTARLSLAQYDRMIEHGVFDQGPRRRLEFIRGEIREMTPIGSEHEEVVDRLTGWSARIVPEARIRVRVQNSIGLCELQRPGTGHRLGCPAGLQRGEARFGRCSADR